MRSLKVLVGVVALAAASSWVDHASARDAEEALRLAKQAIQEQQGKLPAVRTAAPSRTAREDSLAKRLADGDMLLRTRDYERAAIVFSTIVEKHGDNSPGYAEALFKLGETYYRSGQYLSARRAFLKITDDTAGGRVSAFREQALGRLVDVAIRTRDAELLDDLARRLGNAQARGAEGLISYSRARVAVVKGDLGEARAALQAVPATSPYRHQAAYLLGVVALRQVEGSSEAQADDSASVGEKLRTKRQRYRPAIDAFTQVTRLPSDTPEHKHVIDLAWLAIGRLRYETEDWVAAAQAYDKVDRASPEFGTMLYELASVYVQMGDPHRAQRALEVLAVTEPENADVAEAALLRGDLQLRAGQFKKALETFESVQGQYEPMKNSVHAFLTSTSDPAVYYEKLVQEQLDVLSAGQALPPIAVRWAREAQDGPEAFAVVDEVVQTRKLLRRVHQLADRLTVIMQSSSRSKAFPELHAWEQGALAVLNGVMRARGVLGQGLDDVEPGALSGPIGEVRAERRSLQDKALTLPVESAEFQQRDEAAMQRWNSVSQRVQQLELQIDQLQAVTNALRRVLRESAHRGVVRDPASSAQLEQELRADEAQIATYRNQVSELRGQVDHGKTTTGFADPYLFGDDDVRERYRAALSREMELAAGGAAGPAAAAYAQRALGLLASANEVETQVQGVRDEINGQVDGRAREVMDTIRAEQANLGEYASLLDALDGQARLLVGQVAMRNFQLVEQRLATVVLRAEVGITEEAWETREEQMARVRNLQTERVRAEQLLNEELREVLDDAADE